MPLANPTSSTSSSGFTSNPVPALIARRTTVLAPPSLSTVNHLDGASAASATAASTPSLPASSIPRPSTTTTARRHRPDLQQAVSQPTAAVPISTRENISTSKSWSSNHLLRPSGSGYQRKPFDSSGDEGGFAVHPTFRSDAEWRGDVLVRVDGVEFWVHKDVLLFSSPFFQSVLTGGWSESRLSRLMLSEEEEHEQERNKDATESDSSRDVPSRDTGSTNMASLLSPRQDAAREDGPSQPVVVTELAAESPSELEAGNLVHTELDTEHLGGEARRRSLLRASYHTALWSQDDDSRASPTLSQSAATFEDTIEEPDGAGDDSVEGAGSAIEHDSMEDADEGAGFFANRAAVEDDEEAEVDEEPAKREKDGRASQAKQLRSNSKQVATRLTLRKLESAKREKKIPTRSTSRAVDVGCDEVDKATRSHERMESLATPPMSRRPSNDGFGDTDAAMPTAQPAGSRPSDTLPHRYRGIISAIDLSEESASTFHDFLFHIYPHLDLSVTWYNCGPLLRFSDKFQVPYLRRACITFLRAALAGRPIEAMRLAELHTIDDLYREASRHVLDNFAAWQADELEVLSNETLLKLERKRTWFLERLLKLGLANPGRDYECHAACPDPQACARALHDKWQSAYKAAFRYHPPQPSVIFRYLRELDSIGNGAAAGGGGGGIGVGAGGLALSAATAAAVGSGGGGGGAGAGTALQLSNCQTTARVWVQGLFDRMFELGTLHTGRLFLAVKLDAVAPRNLVHKDS
ncbi:hypothetical protein EX895_002029 [Sporisorium graminicola]|uniref:BTB domain-containing protein n=1 Tax=Sporisorium graminicola TaxID=280036 RepID=A0A4U7L175_9BASI|nr:hypothetical protein EX895_002029 [Sporisorium graminicola]TKY89498.1 hypothetical protein EX895_002029 [Sporisorium graminicola]